MSDTNIGSARVAEDIAVPQTIAKNRSAAAAADAEKKRLALFIQ
jgi:hypothetical protein